MLQNEKNGCGRDDTVAVWCQKWWDEVVDPKGLSAGALTKYRSAVKHLTRQFGAWELAEVTLSDFQKWLAELAAANPNTGKPMAHATMQNIRKVGNMVFRYARQNGVPGVPDFFAAVQIPRGAPVERRRALTESELDAVVGVAHPAQSMAMVMLFTGLRIGECVPLTWADVDLEQGVLRVSRSAELQDNHPRVHSGGKTAAARRLVPMPGVLVQYLRSWKAAQGMGLMAVPERPDLFELVDKGITVEQWYAEQHWRKMHWGGGTPILENSNSFNNMDTNSIGGKHASEITTNNPLTNENTTNKPSINESTASNPLTNENTTNKPSTNIRQTSVVPMQEKPSYRWVVGVPGLQDSFGYHNPPPRVEARDNLVFTNLSGGMHSKSSLRRMWDDYRSTLGFHLTPHVLRHTYATLLYLQDVDVRDAMAYMGHATYQVTLGIYTDTEQYCRFNVSDTLLRRLQTEFEIPKPRLHRPQEGLMEARGVDGVGWESI